jgi:4'-phosphopantetheinyl transferase
MCVKLYLCRLEGELAEQDYAFLSSDERDYAQTLRYEQVKRRYLRVRVWVRQVFAAYLQQPADKILLAKNAYGKPYLVDYPSVQFNISHSGEHLLIAISSIGAIGVDIEQPRILHTPLTDLVEKCFSNQEISYWQNLPVAEQLAEFYRFWTRKEAFVKAVGRGIALGLPECVIAVDNPPALVSIPPECGSVNDWRLFDLPLPADLCGALVIENRQLPAGFTLPNIERLAATY